MNEIIIQLCKISGDPLIRRLKRCNDNASPNRRPFFFFIFNNHKLNYYILHYLRKRAKKKRPINLKLLQHLSYTHLLNFIDFEEEKKNGEKKPNL